MEEHNDNYIIISSYDEEVKYFSDVIDNKEHRSPIFIGKGENGKSIFTRMIRNGDIDKTKLKDYINEIINDS